MVGLLGYRLKFILQIKVKMETEVEIGSGSAGRNRFGRGSGGKKKCGSRSGDGSDTARSRSGGGSSVNGINMGIFVLFFLIPKSSRDVEAVDFHAASTALASTSILQIRYL